MVASSECHELSLLSIVITGRHTDLTAFGEKW